jgi:hypothetical protein
MGIRLYDMLKLFCCFGISYLRALNIWCHVLNGEH